MTDAAIIHKLLFSNPEPVKATFKPAIPADEDGEFAAYLITENDKGIYSTENGSRAFAVRKAGEKIDAAYIQELGRFQATTHTAFSVACEKFGKEKIEWMEGA